MNNSPTDLRCLAAKSLCVRLIYDWAEGEIPVIDVWKKGNGYNTCSTHDWFLWQLYEMEVPRSPEMPNKIRYQIEDNLPVVLEQVLIWIQYHHSANFFHDQPSSSLSEYVMKLVWNHHFKIDYAATAKNILTNEKLSSAERFRFASTYCMVEEIANFRDMIDLIASDWDFIKDPFVVYWSKYLKNELHTIEIPVPEDISIETVMFIKALEEFDFWPPVEHFFDKLDSASKASNFERIVHLLGKRYRKDLLAKLNDKEWNLACRNSISKIVDKIAEWGTLDEMRFVWTLFKRKIDSKNFCAVLETLVPLSMRSASNFEKWTPLLVEMWTSASGRLKQSATDTKLWQSIGEKCISHIPNEDTPKFRSRRQINDPMTFVKAVLKSVDVKKRTTFFVNNFYWMIICAPLASADKLMREFLDCYGRNIVKLKKEIFHSSKLDRSLLILLGFGEFDEFDAVLSFCFSGTDGCEDDDKMQKTLTCYKWSLMVPQDGLSALSICLYFADWRLLYEYVKKIIMQARIALDEFMITLIELGFYPGFHHLSEKLSKGEMEDLKECLCTVLPGTDDRLADLKKRFKIGLFKILFDLDWSEERIFKRVRVQNFLMWIYNGDEKLIEKNFKQSQLLAKGFLVQLKGCINDGFCFQATDSMEEFLRWCFQTEAESQQFKRDMIYNYRKYKMIEDLLTRRRYRRCLLFWFFDGDVGLIEKFTADCAGCPIYAQEE